MRSQRGPLIAAPPPPDKSNLLIVRSGCPRPPGSPAAPRRSLHQMMFHKIDPQSLTRVRGGQGTGGTGGHGDGPPPTSLFTPQQGESLGQGSFTHIYKGIKRDQEEDGCHQTDVVLKVMDGSHRNCAEVRQQQPLDQHWGVPRAPP